MSTTVDGPMTALALNKEANAVVVAGKNGERKITIDWQVSEI